MRQITSANGVAATSGCCSYRDMRDAKRVAWALGIDHYSIDTESDFPEPGDSTLPRRLRQRPHAQSMRQLQTGTSGSRRRSKWRTSWARPASRPGTTSGLHQDETTGRPQLKRAADRSKDQSYFLYGIQPEFLSRMLFPVGDYPKDEVRKLAGRFDLPVASQTRQPGYLLHPGGRRPRFPDRAGSGRRRKYRRRSRQYFRRPPRYFPLHHRPTPGPGPRQRPLVRPPRWTRKITKSS